MKYLDLDGLTTFWENAYQKIDDLITTKIQECGNFDSSGTYPNLTAGKATKLATARTISLSGGASGSVSFDGSKEVDIPVTSINEGKMMWNDTYEKSKVSILDTLFRDSFGNKLAYLNPNAIKVEYSRDGGATWLDYGNAIDGTSESINKTRLVTFQCGLGSYYQGKRAQSNEETYTDQLRITIDAIDGNVYFSIKKILIYTSGFVDADNKQVKIETQNYSSSSVDTGLWTTRGIYHIVGQPGWSAIPTTGWPYFGYATSRHIRKVRFTFYQNALSNYRGHVDNIAFLAERVVVGGNSLTKTGHLYTMDESQNATFPAKVTATKHVTRGGTPNQVVLGDGSLKSVSEIGGSGEDSRYSQLLNLLSMSNYNIPDEGVVRGEYVWDDGSNNEEGIARLAFAPDGDGKMLTYSDEFGWLEQTSAWSVPNIPVATTTSGGVMSPEDKGKLDLFTHTKEYVYGDSIESLTWNITEDPEDGQINMYKQRIEKDDNYIEAYLDVYNDNGNKRYNHWIEVGDTDNYTTVSPIGVEGFSVDGGFILNTSGCYTSQFVKSGGTSSQILMADGSVKEISEISSEGSNLDPILTSFVDACKDAGIHYYIPTETMFALSYEWDSEYNEGCLFYDYSNTVNPPSAIRLWYDDDNKLVWEFIDNVAGQFAPGTAAIPVATQEQGGLMSPTDKTKLDGFDGFNTANDYVGADVANGVYGRNNYIDLSGKGLNEGDIIIVTHKNGNYVAYAMLIWTDGGMLEIKNESTPVTTISTQHPYIIFSSVQNTDEITIRKIHTTRL